jgi:hypothetical protein
MSSQPLVPSTASHCFAAVARRVLSSIDPVSACHLSNIELPSESGGARIVPPFGRRKLGTALDVASLSKH